MAKTVHMTFFVRAPRFIWLRFMLPEMVRAFWAGLMRRPFDRDAAIERCSARVLAATKIIAR